MIHTMTGKEIKETARKVQERYYVSKKAAEQQRKLFGRAKVSCPLCMFEGVLVVLEPLKALNDTAKYHVEIGDILGKVLIIRGNHLEFKLFDLSNNSSVK